MAEKTSKFLIDSKGNTTNVDFANPKFVEQSLASGGQIVDSSSSGPSKSQVKQTSSKAGPGSLAVERQWQAADGDPNRGITPQTVTQQPLNPDFYQPKQPVPGYDPKTVFNAQGQPLNYEQYIQQGGKSDFSNVRKGFERAVSSGMEAPQTAGEAYSAIAGLTPTIAPPTPPEVESFFQTNPLVQPSLQQLTDFLSPPSIRMELEQSMKSLLSHQKEAAGLNLELMNTKRVMEGTEQDLRDEIEKAGGFATDSQVLALTVARNKTLLKKANLITDQLSYMADIIQTDMTMLSFQKEQAQQEFQQRSFLLEYKQKNDQFIYKANQEALERNLNLLGADGLYQATGGDPVKIDRIERALGLVQGGLETAAISAARERALQLEKDSLDLDLAREQIQTQQFDRQMDAAKFGLEQDKFLWEVGESGNPGKLLSIDDVKKLSDLGYDVTPGTTYGDIQGMKPTKGQELKQTALGAAQQLLNDFNRGFGKSAVGGNLLNRLGSVGDWLSKGSSRADFISRLDSLKAQLSLDSIKYLKGTGAISDAEQRLLSNAATTLNRNQSEKEFKATLENLIKSLSGSPQGNIIEYNGKRYEVDGQGNFDPGKPISFNSAKGSTSISKIANAIGQYESGGNYKARGPVVTSGMYKGQRALGKYQIMPGNLPSWSKAALGKVVSEQEFLNSPQIQDRIAQHKMGEIYKKHPNIRDVASVWFSGRPLAKAGNAKDVIGTSVPKYVANIEAIYKRLG